MFVMFLILGAIVTAAVLTIDYQRRVDEAWRDMASKLRLDLMGHERLGGHVRGRKVDIDTVIRGTGKNRSKFTRIFVSAPSVASGLTIKGEGAWSKLKKFVGADDVRVMDDGFDAVVQLQGDSVQAVALLDEDVRRHLRFLVEVQKCELDSGTFRREFQGSVTDGRAIVDLVERCVAVANLMDVDGYALEEKLARNAVEDSMPAVRLRNFELLQARYQRHPVTRRVAEQALADDDLGMRIVAARELADDRGFAALRTIAESPGNAEHRLAALQALLDLFPDKQVAPVLDVVLRNGRPEHRALAVRSIGERKDRSRREAVERCLGKGDDDLDVAAATALGQLGDPASEDVLVGLLGVESEAVKRAVVQALGGLASTRSVEALLPLSQGFSLGGGLKDAARDAIRKIQARVGPADGGRLSLAESPATEGALSFATEGGELSVAEPDDGGSRSPNKVRG